MPLFIFQWTPEIVEHLDEHGISQDEFERIVRQPLETGVDRHGNPTAYGYGAG